MRKMVLFLVVAVMAFGVDLQCMKVAKKLYELQNKIVHQSFAKLKPGAYALHAQKGKVIYLGRLRSPKSGEVHYVAQFITRAPLHEVWYDLEKRDVRYGNKIYPFWFIHIKEIYARTRRGMIYIPPDMIDLYMQYRGDQLSQILRPPMQQPLQCQHIPKITKISVTIKGHKISAIKIEDPKTKGYVIASTEVPFGLVGVNGVDLIDYAWSGERSRITQSERKAARTFRLVLPPSIPSLPKIPLLGGGFQ